MIQSMGNPPAPMQHLNFPKHDPGDAPLTVPLQNSTLARRQAIGNRKQKNVGIKIQHPSEFRL